MKFGMKKRSGAKVMAITGPFAIDESYCREALGQMQREFFPRAGWSDDSEDATGEGPDSIKPEVVGSKIALFRFSGPMSKEESCATEMLGGFSTMSAASAIRAAANSGQYAGIAISWYTPGGQTAYMDEFARALRESNAKCPIWSHCEDMCASAGYWGASQSSQVWCSPNAIVGSIGTYMAIEDSSKAAASAGYEVIVIKAGEHKGDGLPGTEITDTIKAKYQRTIDSINSLFISDVAQGRSISLEDAKSLNTGDVWVGKEAKAKGIVDEVGSLEDMLSAMGAALPGIGQSQRTVPGQPGAMSIEETMNEKEKLGFVSQMLSFLGFSAKAEDVDADKSKAGDVPDEPKAADPLDSLSSEEKAAVLQLRQPKEEPKAADKEEPKDDVPDLERDEAVASYVASYNRVRGAGAIDFERADKALAGKTADEINARAKELGGKAEEKFGKPTGERASKGAITRADLLASGRY